MTQIFSFAPTQNAPPFTFQPTLDGSGYTVSVSWNFMAQRWYLSITDQNGNVIVNRPMIGSPAQQPLVGSSWANGIVTAIASSFLGYRTGSLVDISIAGAIPAAIAGIFPCTITGPTSFIYAVDDDPGSVTSAGSWSVDCNLIGGFFSSSILVFRPSTGNFEVSP